MQLAISKTSPRIKWGILVGILLMVSTIFCVSPTARQRLESITDMKGLSVTYRFSMWSSAWQQFVDHPVIGIGLGNAPAVHSRYVLPDRAHLPSTQHPHSVPIQLLAETGLVGTTAYYSLYGYVLMLLFRQRQRGSVFATAMIISIVAVQICSLTENLLYGVLAVKQSEWFLIGVFAGEHLNLSSSDLPIWGKRSL